MRRIALRDLRFNASVLSSTRKHLQISNAWRSMRYLASVLTAVRCHAGAIQVEPISTRRLARSIFMKRVLPITLPELRSTVAKTIGLAAFLFLESLLDETLKVFARSSCGRESSGKCRRGIFGDFPEEFGMLAANRLEANDGTFQRERCNNLSWRSCQTHLMSSFPDCCPLSCILRLSAASLLRRDL